MTQQPDKPASAAKATPATKDAKQGKAPTTAASRKLRQHAEELWQFAVKIYHFRRDVLTPGDLARLEGEAEKMKALLADKVTPAAALEAGSQSLDAILRQTGGRLYPRNFWNENVEMILVAVLLVIGVRSFFAQPFIIPTNSMYPTYNGLTTKVYAPGEAAPNLAGQAIRVALKGARHKSVMAPADGEVILPLGRGPDGREGVAYELKWGGRFGFIPGKQREYTFLCGPAGVPRKIRLPQDFSLEEFLYSKVFPGQRPVVVNRNGQRGISLGEFARGEPVLRFDLLLGDMLFVDRMSYHFRKPRVGDPFVFRTGQIPGLSAYFPNPEDKYYIKRLVGEPGDTLKVEPPVLLRNGQPIQGAEAFDLNARREGEYEGYIQARFGATVPVGAMTPGNSVQLPPGCYYAMGDNSDQSLDSRNWGFVPEDQIIGRALLIYFPFGRFHLAR